MENYILALAMYIILMSLVYNIFRYMDAVLGTSITETVQGTISKIKKAWKNVNFVTKK